LVEKDEAELALYDIPLYFAINWEITLAIDMSDTEQTDLKALAISESTDTFTCMYSEILI